MGNNSNYSVRVGRGLSARRETRKTDQIWVLLRHNYYSGNSQANLSVSHGSEFAAPGTALRRRRFRVLITILDGQPVLKNATTL